MGIKQEILKELRKGTPIARIRKKFRSKSQTYEAFREYLLEADNNLNAKQTMLRETEAKLLRADGELQRVCRDKISVSAEAAKLQQARASLTVEVRDATEKRNQLIAEVKGLEAKGYLPTIIKKLKAVEASSGQELLAQVETAAKYEAIKKEFSSLEKLKAGLEGNIKALEAKGANIKQLIISEENTLDEMKLRTVTFGKAEVAVESLLKAGYSPEDIKSLERGLALLGIKGDPRSSLERLVRGLTKQKTLRAVEEKLRKTRLELETVNEDLAAVKSELAAKGQATLKTIKEGQEASEQAVAHARDISTQAIVETSKRAEEAIERIVQKLEARGDESVGKFDAQIRLAAGSYEAELKQITELESRRAEVETLLEEGLPLVGMLKSREDLKKVPLPYILQLLEKIQAWVELNLPDASTKPAEYIRAKEHNLTTICSYKLSVLIELAKEGLKQRLPGAAHGT